MFTLANLDNSTVVNSLLSLELKSCHSNVALIQGWYLFKKNWTRQKDRNYWSLGEQKLGPMWQPNLLQGGLNVVRDVIKGCNLKHYLLQLNKHDGR